MPALNAKNIAIAAGIVVVLYLVWRWVKPVAVTPAMSAVNIGADIGATGGVVKPSGSVPSRDAPVNPVNGGYGGVTIGSQVGMVR